MPFITTAAITSLIIVLAQKGLEKAFETTGEKISEGAFHWIKSLFYKDGKPQKIIQEIQEDPQNEEKIENARAIIENSIDGNPDFKAYLDEFLEKLPKVNNTISNSKNIVTGSASTGGGHFINGDNNQISG